ncbi:MAG: type II toxin-antitoxin system RelE/ParE family toxin [Bacteroidetes bacterium]|nr:type II toxin-antitoxin system RelE/ParE family toxin [Bacteroidota bacterium]MCL1968584.1 type II toxin-antitoxin system RelE/ParE family toxin [Bacteroidota bacterium]
MTIKWYIDAVNDLDKIYDYYVSKNPRAAAVLYNKILDDVEILKTQPYIAPIEQMLIKCPENYRSLVVENYKVVYFVEEDLVLIVQIFDCRQNPIKFKRTILRRKKTF